MTGQNGAVSNLQENVKALGELANPAMMQQRHKTKRAAYRLNSVSRAARFCAMSSPESTAPTWISHFRGVGGGCEGLVCVPVKVDNQGTSASVNLHSPTGTCSPVKGSIVSSWVPAADLCHSGECRTCETSMRQL